MQRESGYRCSELWFQVHVEICATARAARARKGRS